MTNRMRRYVLLYDTYIRRFGIECSLITHNSMLRILGRVATGEENIRWAVREYDVSLLSFGVECDYIWSSDINRIIETNNK